MTNQLANLVRRDLSHPLALGTRNWGGEARCPLQAMQRAGHCARMLHPTLNPQYLWRPFVLERSPKPSAQQQLGLIQTSICPRQRWVMCYGGSAQQPGLPELPTIHPSRTAGAVRVPADPNCFKLEGRASANSSQVQADPFPVTRWTVNPGCKTTMAQSPLSLPVSSYPKGGHSPPPPRDEDHAWWDGAEVEQCWGRTSQGRELPEVAVLTAEMMSEVFSAMCWTPAPP